MRQSYSVISEIEALVYLFAEPESINKAVLTCCSLAGNHGADKRAGAARDESVFVEIGNKLFNIGIMNALNFQSEP